MQTTLQEKYKNSAVGREAETILRSCVHCGFCTATCPTYQLLGDELDGPRGRIYLIKQMLEGAPVTRRTQLHLDRCLTCRACETTCPSGVRYGRLVDIGRELVERSVHRGRLAAATRAVLRTVLPRRRLFAILLRLGQGARRLLPAALRRKIPAPQTPGPWPPAAAGTRQMLAFAGCVQDGATPRTNVAAAQVLARLGISLLPAPEAAGCCGAVSYHLSDHAAALASARSNIDAWWPWVERGIEAIVICASGCGVMLKDYAALLAQDPVYGEKARRIAALAKDLSEVIAAEPLPALPGAATVSVAFHAPCTLQHGQKIVGVVESILTRAGFKLTTVENAHLCCGSAGTYSLLQPRLARRLLTNKIAALQHQQPDQIATANIGCQLHLATQASVPVRHWIELLAERL